PRTAGDQRPIGSDAEKEARRAGAEHKDGAEQHLPLHTKTIKLHEIATAIGTRRDLRKLLEEIMEAVLELVDAERGFLILKGTRSEGAPDATEAEKAITVSRNF